MASSNMFVVDDITTAWSTGQSATLQSESGSISISSSGTATVYGTPGTSLRTTYSVATVFCVDGSSQTYTVFGDLT
jgi:hypothetical protein